MKGNCISIVVFFYNFDKLLNKYFIKFKNTALKLEILSNIYFFFFFFLFENVRMLKINLDGTSKS